MYIAAERRRRSGGEAEEPGQPRASTIKDSLSLAFLPARLLSSTRSRNLFYLRAPDPPRFQCPDATCRNQHACYSLASVPEFLSTRSRACSSFAIFFHVEIFHLIRWELGAETAKRCLDESRDDQQVSVKDRPTRMDLFAVENEGTVATKSIRSSSYLLLYLHANRVLRCPRSFFRFINKRQMSDILCSMSYY